MIDDLQILAAWPVGQVFTTTSPPTGAINRTVLVEATTGRYVLRAYRHRTRQRVEWEHAIIHHAHRHGLPVPTPLALPNGGTILQHAGRFFALFPYARGHHLRLHELRTTEIAAMGAFLARVHRVLQTFPHELVFRRTFAVDRAATLANIDKLRATILRRTVLLDSDKHALQRLAGQRRWIEDCTITTLPDLSRLDQQVIHGDYQLTNLFFEAGQVSAIIDWDQAYVAARAWEVVRTLHFGFDLEPGACQVFVKAYRRELPLSPEDLELAAAAYGLMRAHDLWSFEAIYLDGNERVRRFIRPGGFVPFSERWATLSDSLSY